MFVGVGASRVRDLFETAKRMRRVLSLSMKSMQLDASVAPVLVVDTMNASKH